MIALQALMAAGVALAAAALAARARAARAALLVPGAAIGALFTTLYLLVDRLAPAGSGTQTFAWLVTANNGGLAVGAAVAGALTERQGPPPGCGSPRFARSPASFPPRCGGTYVRTRYPAAYRCPSFR